MVLPGGLPWVWGSQTSRLPLARQGLGCQRCETAHQAAWAGAALTSSFGEYFRIDEQNKFISGMAKFSLNVFSFPALKVDETRAGKPAEGQRREHYIF